MKRGILFLGALLLCFNFANAADCTIETLPCSAGMPVDGFYFSESTNAHASALNVAGYGSVLCCDPINISFLSGTNDVVKLSDTRNAHLGILGAASPYSLTLKMVNATCRDAASCVGQEFCLFSLALQTNSHASQCGTAGYGIDICCNSTLSAAIPPLGICGDGVIDTPNNNSINERCDGLNLDSENCTTRGFDDGTLTCYPVGHADECLFNTGGCFMTSTDPPVAGPNEYYVYGDCVDDGDGDEYGQANWTIYSGSGLSTNNGTILCQLNSEEVPFLGNLSFLIFLTILGGFYIHNYLRRCNKCKL
jgi:hypothetical protein